MKRLYFDTEFTGLHKNTTLISIGMVSEDNRFLYAELNDYDESQIEPWLEENVISHLLFKDREVARIDTEGSIYIKGSSLQVKEAIEEWASTLISKDEKIELWSDCLSYDWVLFNHLWGSALNLPSIFYYIPCDLCTVLKLKGIDPDISREALAEGLIHTPAINPSVLFKHNALWDAFVIRACIDSQGV